MGFLLSRAFGTGVIRLQNTRLDRCGPDTQKFTPLPTSQHRGMIPGDFRYQVFLVIASSRLGLTARLESLVASTWAITMLAKRCYRANKVLHMSFPLLRRSTSHASFLS